MEFYKNKQSNSEKKDLTHFETVAETINTINKAIPPIFNINEKEIKADELTRLKNRFLDLRRPSQQAFLTKRHQIALATRNCLSKEGFTEIETPMLTKSTPEGARDFVVPSRVHEDHFALPQSPQLFKQLLMMSGMENTFKL